MEKIFFMKAGGICFIYIFFVLNVSGQVNRYNANGKKQGYWVEYVDENMKPSDGINYNYKRLEFYDGGKPVLNLKKIYKHSRCKFYRSAQYNNNEKWLDGFAIDSARSIKSQIDEYSHGYPVKFLFYAPLSSSRDTGYVERVFYKRLTDTSTIAFYYEYRTKNFVNNTWDIKKYYFMKTKKGKWKYVRIKQ